VCLLRRFERFLGLFVEQVIDPHSPVCGEGETSGGPTTPNPTPYAVTAPFAAV